MAANKKFEKLGINPDYIDTSANETTSDAPVAEHKYKRKVYSFRKASPIRKKIKIYEVGFISVYVAFIAVMVLSVIHSMMISEDFYSGLSGNMPYVIRSLASVIIFLIPALVFCKYKGVGGFSLLRFHRFSQSYTTFLVLNAVLTILIVSAEKFALTYYFSINDTVHTIGLFASSNKLGLIMAYAVLPAICEEVFFRGVLLTEISKKAGGFAGILVSALLYSLIKFEAGYFPVYFTLGIILAFTVHFTGSVVPAIIISMANNVAALMFSSQLGFIASERAGNLFLMIILLISIFVVLLFTLKTIEGLCSKKASAVEGETADDASEQIKFYSEPIRLYSDTGYTLHKFLRVLVSPAVITAVIVYIFAIILLF